MPGGDLTTSASQATPPPGMASAANVAVKPPTTQSLRKHIRSMAFLHSLPAPHSLEINDSNVAEKWREWKEMWEHHSVASKVNKEEGDIQVATFLTAIGPEAREVFKTWNLSATERKDIKGVIERFDNYMYCNPRKNLFLRALSFQFATARAWRIVWSPCDCTSSNR